MYRRDRNDIISIMDSLIEMHSDIRTDFENEGGKYDGDAYVSALGECQQAAVSAGEFLEELAKKEETADAGSMISAVHKLEEYCELLYKASEAPGADSFEQMDKCIFFAKEIISGIRVRFKALFMPYKVEMWDSLESIYLAAVADSRCEAKVVPLMYFTRDNEAGEWIRHYDGERFSQSIPVIHYDAYDIEADRPDVVYIHNPYDNHNLVSTVDPRFYSFEIKKYADVLVYVPYYVTAGSLNETFKILPVYRNMDYAVFQSEHVKELCKAYNYYDRILPLGSPKFDKVINKCKVGADIPDDWKRKLEGKKVLMLNSSLNDFLAWNDLMLKKVKLLFEHISKDSRLALIWRPHPLLESTLKALRPEFYSEYVELKKYYIDSDIGIYDDRPDLSDTVAVSDGYIGSDGSSAITYFEVTGKPIFLYNNMIYKAGGKEERCCLYFTRAMCGKDRLYLFSWGLNALWSVPYEKMPHEGGTIRAEAELEKVLEDVPRTQLAYGTPDMCGDEIFFPESFMGHSAILHTGGNAVTEMIPVDDMMKNAAGFFRGRYGSAVTVGDSVYCMPVVNEQMAEYRVKEEKFRDHSKSIATLCSDYGRAVDKSTLYGMAIFGGRLFCSTGRDNKVIVFTPGKDDPEFIYVGSDSYSQEIRIVLKGANDKGFFFEDVPADLDKPFQKSLASVITSADRKKQLIYVDADKLNDRSAFVCFDAPDDCSFRIRTSGNEAGVFGAVVEAKGKYFVLPALSSHCFEIDMEKRLLVPVMEVFWSKCDERGYCYDPVYSFPYNTCKKLPDGRLFVQRGYDNHVVIYDPEDGTYTEVIIEADEETLDAILPEESAFERSLDRHIFAMRESAFFSLEYFLEHFAEDGFASIHDREIEEVSDMAENMDGTCGQKVHDHIRGLMQ